MHKHVHMHMQVRVGVGRLQRAFPRGELAPHLVERHTERRRVAAHELLRTRLRRRGTRHRRALRALGLGHPQQPGVPPAHRLGRLGLSHCGGTARRGQLRRRRRRRLGRRRALRAARLRFGRELCGEGLGALLRGLLGGDEVAVAVGQGSALRRERRVELGRPRLALLELRLQRGARGGALLLRRLRRLRLRRCGGARLLRRRSRLEQPLLLGARLRGCRITGGQKWALLRVVICKGAWGWALAGGASFLLAPPGAQRSATYSLLAAAPYWPLTSLSAALLLFAFAVAALAVAVASAASASAALRASDTTRICSPAPPACSGERVGLGSGLGLGIVPG